VSQGERPKGGKHQKAPIVAVGKMILNNNNGLENHPSDDPEVMRKTTAYAERNALRPLGAR